MRILPKWVGKWPVALAMTFTSVLMMAGCGGSSSPSNNVTAMPSFRPGGGTYNASQTVTISTATANAVLYCTTDGTTPTPSSPQCSQPTTVFKSEFLQAIAVAPGMSASAVASAGYTVDLSAAATPTFSPAGGTYTSPQSVTIADATSGSNIYYTTDGSMPSASSTLYTGPVTVSQSETLSAIAMASGYNNSVIATTAYTIGAPAPTIASLLPATATAGGAAFTLIVNGTNFVSGATVNWGSAALTTTYLSATQLTAAVPASLIATAGTASVTVTEAGGTSSGATFTISPAPPAPTITGLSPSFATAGGPEFTLTINGTNFDTGTTVQWGTTALARSYVSPTQLTANVPASLIATAGTATVTVTASGGTSSGATFTINAAPPTITGLSPASGAVGSSVTITGMNFGSTQGASTVTFNGTAASSITSWSSTSITAVVPANATTGNVVVTVNGVSSTGSAFTVLSPPAITGLSPTSGAVGFSVIITGTNFGSTQGTVSFNGTPVTSITSWNSTSITAVVPVGATTGNVVVTVNGLVSNGIAFTVLPTPGIGSLSPTSAPVGSSVTITGTNFGATQGTSAVTFNGTPATSITSWSNTQIVAAVPTGATTGNVVVTVNGVASLGLPFTVLAPPTISSLSPASGPVGSSVTITGTNFGSAQGSSTVSFNGTAATSITNWSSTSITAVVPANATTGNVVVTVSGVSSSGSAFTVLPTPTITSFAPASGAVGASVTITGTNFGVTQGTSTVSFNGTPATSIASWSSTSITTVVPTGATTGNVVVAVNGVASAGAVFTVPGTASISSLSPTSGLVGSSVIINGANFGSTQGTSTVSFNGTPATSITSWSSTSITAVVPGGATTGNIVVTANGVTTNGVQFTVLQTPTITQLNPTSGAVGSSVIITGTNFGSTQGASTVSFNGTLATSITSWSNTSIAAVVPANATTGNVVVAVSGVASAGSAFTVLPTPIIASLNPASGGVGSSVTITGTNFGSTQGASTVSFNGTLATSITSWSSTSITAVVPASATTGNVVVTVSGVASVGSSFTVLATPTITQLNPASGAVGASVIITGTNFGATQGASTVTFNGTPTTSITSWSSTSITAAVPASATTGNVVVTVSGVASAGSAFTVLPTPTITSLNPASGAVGASVTITGTNFGATQGTSMVTFNGTTATSIASWSATSIVAVVPTGATTGNVVVTVSGVASAGSAFTVTVAGPTISGTVSSGSLPVIGSSVQLYAAGTSGYGTGATTLGSPVTTAAGGAFAVPMPSTCPAAPGDQLYLVATGGDSGSGTNATIALMTALGSCSQFSTSGTTVTVNEVTTVASAYALSAFATVNSPSFGIDVGAPGTGSSCNAASNWQSTGQATCNYPGLVNAIKAVNNLANLGTGTALSITPAYAANPVAYLNSSTVPTARINALADMLASCVESDGSGCGSGLFGAAATNGSAPGGLSITPVDTLQAALNIAQNPGSNGINLAGLLGLIPATNPPYATTLSATAAPTDLTLALTYTGAGLGIPPTTSGTTTVGTTTYSTVGPIENTSLAIDASGNVWVTAYSEDGVSSTYSTAISPLLAGFNNLGAPLTPPTTVDSNSVVTFGGFNPNPASASAGLSSIAIDQAGTLWLGEGGSDGTDIFAISTAGSSLSLSLSPINNKQTVLNLAIDSNGNLWAAGALFAEYQNNGTAVTLSNPTGLPVTLDYLTFDSNDALWVYGTPDPVTSGPDVDQASDSNGAALFEAFQSSPGAANSTTLGYVTLVADGSGNVYGCADSTRALDIFNSGVWVNSGSAPVIATGRSCGFQLVLDGQGHLFAVSNTERSPSAVSKRFIDEFTTQGAVISPTTTGYTGTSSTEQPTLNPDGARGGRVPGISAAIDGSGNLWVLNLDTNGPALPAPSTPGNVLVEYIGIGAPVVTPTSVALTNGVLGVRP